MHIYLVGPLRPRLVFFLLRTGQNFGHPHPPPSTLKNRNDAGEINNGLVFIYLQQIYTNKTILLAINSKISISLLNYEKKQFQHKTPMFVIWPCNTFLGNNITLNKTWQDLYKSGLTYASSLRS